MSRHAVTALVGVSLMACQTLANETPALLTHSDDSAVVASALRNALGTQVQLAQDAFVTKSWLVLETGRDAIGKSAADGRRIEEPRRLELRLAGADCLVFDSQTGKRIALPALECRPE